MSARTVLATIVLALVVAGSAGAGAAPNRLDRTLGTVVPAARIHNLFWDDAWSTQHPTFTRGMINTFTARITSTGYAGSLGEYGVTPPTFAGSQSASPICGATQAPNFVTTAAVISWLLCEVNVPGTGVPFPGIRSPISNDLYVVYLPSNTRISDSMGIPQITLLGRVFGPYTVSHTSCDDYGAYHYWAVSVTAYFTFAIIPTRCAVNADNDRPPLDNITLAASHEIVEATTNPFVGLGWIDRSIPISAPGFRRLSEGEASDICDFLPTPAAPVRRPSSGGSLFSPYWSNAAGACVTH